MNWLFFHSHTSFPLGSLENRNPWVHSPLSSDISVKAIAPLTLILFKPLLTLFSYMLWLKPQQIRESPQNHLNVNWTEFVNETKLDTHMLSTKVDNEIRINHMRQKQEKCDSFAWNPSYYEHLFIITSLAITQTVELWMNTGVYPLLSFCIIVRHCFCSHVFSAVLTNWPWQNQSSNSQSDQVTVCNCGRSWDMLTSHPSYPKLDGICLISKHPKGLPNSQ